MTPKTSIERDARGRFMRRYTPAQRAAVRTDYEGTSIPIEELSVTHRVPKGTIRDWIIKEGWVRRRPLTIDPNDLVSRLLGLLDRQMTELETAMNRGATEVAMLAKLVTTLDKLLLLKERSAAAQPKSSPRADELRAKIAERIGELNRA